MLKVSKKMSRGFRLTSLPGRTVEVRTFPPKITKPPDPEAKFYGMVQVTLGRRLTPEAIGTKRTIVTRAITCREGRMLKTTISLTPDVAVMLRDALNEVLSEAGIYEVLESEIALAT